ncbi:MAG: hypothetical protein OXG15_05205 [Gammaproteobacteria bacterium]|nr:hypothetical protein [Gammaproteobacteria bacterium]
MRLNYTQEELLREHDFAELHVIDGQRLHGGFDEEGRYVPPRSKVRPEAISNWTSALRERGGDLLDADSSLLSGPRVPNFEQQCLLIGNGLGRVFWNGLTVTGKIEGRGRMLATTPFPDLQPLVVEDISDMAIGHLNKGLMIAHGIDEGGIPEEGIGGHDVMWFIARDLAFGRDAYPDADPPGRIAREEEEGQRRMPAIPLPYEGFLSFLMNLLLIEFRAEIGFASSQRIFRTTELFPGREEQALEAAEIIERIRTDELIHVESLRLYLGELRSLTLCREDGGTMPGHEIVDPFWQNLVTWSVGEQPRLVAAQTHASIADMIDEHSDGTGVRKRFDELRDEGYELAAA